MLQTHREHALQQPQTNQRQQTLDAVLDLQHSRTVQAAAGMRSLEWAGIWQVQESSLTSPCSSGNQQVQEKGLIRSTSSGMHQVQGMSLMGSGSSGMQQMQP